MPWGQSEIFCLEKLCKHVGPIWEKIKKKSPFVAAANKKKWGEETRQKKKIALSLFVDPSRKKVLVQLPASVERFGVSRVRDFVVENPTKKPEQKSEKIIRYGIAAPIRIGLEIYCLPYVESFICFLVLVLLSTNAERFSVSRMRDCIILFSIL